MSSCSTQISTLVEKARRTGFYHLTRLRKFRISALQRSLYSTTTTEAVFSGRITTWFGNCNHQRTCLPCLQDIWTRQCRSRVHTLYKDIHHTNHELSSYSSGQMPYHQLTMTKHDHIHIYIFLDYYWLYIKFFHDFCVKCTVLLCWRCYSYPNFTAAVISTICMWHLAS